MLPGSFSDASVTDLSLAVTALRVMVVDDNVDAANSLAWAVEALGDEVETCHDGRKAVAAAYAFLPHVILLDLNMPEMDGLQVCTLLRSDPRLMGVKIIAQTGRAEPEARQLTAAAGFDLHLVKPVDLDLLADVLELLRSERARLRPVRDQGAE